MCGICGVVNWEGPPDAEPVRAMSSTMVHRGPNADGLIIRPPAILAHRRLSIIDLSDGANQPMVDDSGRYSITFNGEIYNYRVLRTKLEGFGIRFRTQSDTEVLLNAYIAWFERKNSNHQRLACGVLTIVLRVESFRGTVMRSPFRIL